MLAEMWRRSGADTVIYTGAGLSTASGMGFSSVQEAALKLTRASGCRHRGLCLQSQ